MQNAVFTSIPVGRVGRAPFSSVHLHRTQVQVSRPTVEQKTKVCLESGGFDTPRKNQRGYSTTVGFLHESGWLNG